MRIPAMIRRRYSERGEGKGQFYITMAIVGIIGFALFKFVPVWYTTTDFNAKVSELASVAALRGYKDQKIKDEFVKIRNGARMPEETEFTIERKGDDLILKVKYTLHIDFIVYGYDWEENKSFTYAAN